ncbi:MAG: transglycosylase domain-containing protein [Clostridiales bacterium]|nr:transglycosylase domain-containing protein [Clostridiales bacterium]
MKGKANKSIRGNRSLLRFYRGAHHKIRKRHFFLAAGVLCYAVLCMAISFILSRMSLHRLDVNRIIGAPQSLLIYDMNGEEISCLYGAENRIPVSIETLPPHLVDAFIAAEDARFFSHPGFDLIRIGGAVLQDLKSMSYAEGASTITQQLMKLSHLSPDKNLVRKIDEVILSYQIEQSYSKEEILELYLNYVYFGNGCYGIEAAARRYFGVSASELSLSQSALLAGVVNAPNRLAPNQFPEAALRRRDLVLDWMEDYAFIEPAQAAFAKADPLALAESETNGRRGYYVDLALTSACETLGVDMPTLLSGGYRIYTEMDSDLQAHCEELFDRDDYFPVVATTGPDGWVTREAPSAAIVIVDAADGGVAAIMGGRENDVALAFNRATRMRRQTGSTIKPILVYAPALLRGYTAASILADEPAGYGDFTSQNANGQYAGQVTLRQAVTDSLHAPAVSVLSTLGVEHCKSFARDLGIPFDARDTELSLAFGGFTYGVSPCQLAGAYAAFASGGVYHEPYVVSRITNSDGQLLFTRNTEGKRVMDNGNAFILNDMLQSAVETGAAKRLADLDIGLAASIGASSDNAYRDIWLAAYNPQYAAVVWMGFDDSNGGRRLPGNISGGGYPAELLHEVFSRIYADAPAPQFVVPDSVARLELDQYQTDIISDNASDYEYFVRGTEPPRFSEQGISAILPYVKKTLADWFR